MIRYFMVYMHLTLSVAKMLKWLTDTGIYEEIYMKISKCFPSRTSYEGITTILAQAHFEKKKR